MHEVIARRLTQSVISMQAQAKPDDSQFRPRHFSPQDRSMKALLSKEERLRRRGAERRVEDASFDVRRLLLKCEARRATQRPPPSRISCENRPKWDGGIINLTPVGDGSPVAQRVSECDNLRPKEEK